tara:strand:- start:6 stop:140 length:135 start_codon:yes stop_codon:yes gene_type:complete
VTFADAYNMPVNLRAWWVKRINWTIDQKNKAQEKANKQATQRKK